MRILNYNNFLFENYSKTNLKKVVLLANKYPDFVKSEFNINMNSDFIKLLDSEFDSLDWLNKSTFNFFVYKTVINNIEFINDCKEIGIDIQFIYKSIHMSYVRKLVPSYQSKNNNESNNNEYLSWFLYDKNTKKIYLVPGGGNDFNTSKIIGTGTNKIVRASKSNKFVIKNIEDISTFEIYINNKYPDIFATYFINNTNLVKQEKLSLELEINDNDLTKLEQKIISILEKEGFIDIEIDFHSENVGFDNNSNLKCFDYLTLGYIDNSVAGPAPLISSCVSKYITLKELLKSFNNHRGLISNHLIQNLNHNENYKLFNNTNNTNNTNIVGINIINNSKKEIYLNYSYKKLKPYLNDNLIIFAMDYTKYDEGFDD